MGLGFRVLGFRGCSLVCCCSFAGAGYVLKHMGFRRHTKSKTPPSRPPGLQAPGFSGFPPLIPEPSALSPEVKSEGQVPYMPTSSPSSLSSSSS